MKLSLFSFLLFSTIMLCFATDAHAALTGVNKAAVVLCDVISIIRGRIGRVITMFAVIGLAVAFVMGSISWQKLMMVSVGIGIFYGAESIAFLILPAMVTGVSGTMANGKVFDPNKKYSPQEIVAQVCPEIGMFSGSPSFSGRITIS